MSAVTGGVKLSAGESLDEATRRRRLSVGVAFGRQQQSLVKSWEPHRFVAIVRDSAGLPASEVEDTAPA